MQLENQRAFRSVAILATLKCGLGLIFVILYFLLAAQHDLKAKCVDEPLEFIAFAKWGFVGLLVVSIFCTFLQLKSLQLNLNRPECYYGWGRLLEIFSAMFGICIWFFGCLAVFQYEKCHDVFANTVIRITCASPVVFILYFVYRGVYTWISENRRRKANIAIKSWLSKKEVSKRDEAILPEMRRIQIELENNLREFERIKTSFQKENQHMNNSELAASQEKNN